MKTIIMTSALTVFLLLLGHSSAADEEIMDSTSPAAKTATATFAGGCFWCVEADFEKLDGVLEAVSGYTGGHVARPTYKQVSSGTTGHLESVQVLYDPQKVSYKELVEYFFRHVNPTDAEGQFVDRGKQYSTAIFFHDQQQHQVALTVKSALDESGQFPKPIITPIIKSSSFYKAEKYHQNYYKKHSIKYKYYRYRSGRDDYLSKTWKSSRE